MHLLLARCQDYATSLSLSFYTKNSKSLGVHADAKLCYRYVAPFLSDIPAKNKILMGIELAMAKANLEKYLAVYSQWFHSSNKYAAVFSFLS